MDTTAPHAARELELTFSLARDDVPYVADLLAWAPAGWPDYVTSASRRPPRTVLHFYLEPHESEEVRRLRVKARRGSLVIALESKRVVRHDTFLAEKEELVHNDDLPFEALPAIASSPGSVLSAFAKNQYRVFFRCAQSSFKASLDQIIPFRPDSPLVTATPFWHFELEEKVAWDPASFLRSPFFLQNLQPILWPLVLSKWESSCMGRPSHIPACSAESVEHYLGSILGDAMRERPGWHSLPRA